MIHCYLCCDTGLVQYFEQRETKNGNINYSFAARCNCNQAAQHNSSIPTIFQKLPKLAIDDMEKTNRAWLQSSATEDRFKFLKIAK